ncbi:hypothetical protein KR093_005668 [Drosophila rubida]|uniref:Uncharacterized protein n=1 Tax=Drosophila rubida TaxID=30044 RepID=A0AAD4JTZ4_9MUSC|nr:hypothetical protein KR093_005668 [Drosophila rubida]
MSQLFGEELLETLSYERSKAWSSFFKNCLEKDDGKEIEFSQLDELFQPEDESKNDVIAEAKEDNVEDDLNKSTQCLTNTELTLLLCRGGQNQLLRQTLPIMEEHERKWKQAGLVRILNTFDAEKIEQHVGGWLRRHNNSTANKQSNSTEPTTSTPLKRVYSSSHSNESDAESMHSMDTARYIRASRKRNVSTGTKSSSSLTTIKMYRTLPRKRAELREKYACQADELHEEQEHRHHMQSLLHRRHQLHRRIREQAVSRQRHHYHSVTSVSFNGQQRRKKLRKRRYTSLAAASASSSSSEDCDCGAAGCSCRRRCCSNRSYHIYSYQSECHCLPTTWLKSSRAKWIKRKTAPAFEQQPVPNKMCRRENDSSENSPIESKPANSRSPESIGKHCKKQLPLREVSASFSSKDKLKRRAEEQSDSSENCINVSRRVKQKCKQQVIESDDSMTEAAHLPVQESMFAARSPASERSQSDSSEDFLSVSRSVKRKCKHSKQKLQVRESEDSKTEAALHQPQDSMSSAGSPACEESQSDCSKNLTTRRMKRRHHLQLTDSNANVDMTELDHITDLRGDSSNESIIASSSKKHSKSLQQIRDSDVEQQRGFAITAKGILLHKPAAAEPEHALNSTGNENEFVLKRGFAITAKGILLHKPEAAEPEHALNSTGNENEFVLTKDVLSPIIGRRKASRFMKYHIGGRSYDGSRHIYYRPSAMILAKLKDGAVPGDSHPSSCSESSEEADVFEMFGRYGSIAASNS